MKKGTKKNADANANNTATETTATPEVTNTTTPAPTVAPGESKEAELVGKVADTGRAANSGDSLPKGNTLEQQSQATQQQSEGDSTKKGRDYAKEYARRKRNEGGSTKADSSTGEGKEKKQSASQQASSTEASDAISAMVNGGLATFSMFGGFDYETLKLQPDQLKALQACAPEGAPVKNWFMYGLTLSLCLGGNVAMAIMAKKQLAEAPATALKALTDQLRKDPKARAEIIQMLVQMDAADATAQHKQAA